jgi:hypothetical protein
MAILKEFISAAYFAFSFKLSAKGAQITTVMQYEQVSKDDGGKHHTLRWLNLSM